MDQNIVEDALFAFDHYRNQDIRPLAGELAGNPAYNRLSIYLEKMKKMGGDCSPNKHDPHPINKLPPELLIHIFDIAAREHRNAPLIFFMVSKTWRNLVEHTASLWTTIYINGSAHIGVNTWEEAHAYLQLSKQATLSVTIASGSNLLLHKIEQLFGGSWNRIQEFDWFTRSTEGAPSISHLLLRMNGLRNLSLDTYQHDLPTAIASPGFPSLNSLSIAVHAVSYLHELLKAIGRLLQLKTLKVMHGSQFSVDEPFKAELFSSLRIENLFVSDDAFFVIHRKELWLEHLVLAPLVTQLELHVYHYRLSDNTLAKGRTYRINPRLHTINFSGLPNMLDILSMFNPAQMIYLSNISITDHAPPDAARKTLKILSQFKNLERLTYGIKIGIEDDHHSSPVNGLETQELIFPNLLCLNFRLYETFDMVVFRDIQAPKLMELQISRTQHPSSHFMPLSDSLDQLLSSCVGIRHIELSGFEWPTTQTFTFPDLRKITFSSPHISLVDFKMSEYTNLEVEWTITDPAIIRRKQGLSNPVASHGITYLHSIEVLIISAGIANKRRNLVEEFVSLLPDLEKMRVLHLPFESGNTKIPIDIISAKLLSNSNLCPNLEEIHIRNYPTDWDLLLDLIMSRNMLPKGFREGAPRKLVTIAFPQTLHQDIHNLVVDALSGQIVPAVPPWRLPTDL